MVKNKPKLPILDNLGLFYFLLFNSSSFLFKKRSFSRKDRSLILNSFDFSLIANKNDAKELTANPPPIILSLFTDPAV